MLLIVKVIGIVWLRKVAYFDCELEKISQEDVSVSANYVRKAEH